MAACDSNTSECIENTVALHEGTAAGMQPLVSHPPTTAWNASAHASVRLAITSCNNTLSSEARRENGG
eukprot:1669933-Amphidinium_carterae.1